MKDDVVLGRVAIGAQIVSGKGRVGIADRHPAQDGVFLRDVELFADDLGVAGDRHLHAGTVKFTMIGVVKPIKKKSDIFFFEWAFYLTFHFFLQKK